MPFFNPPKHQKPQLIVSLCGDFQRYRIIPKALRFNEIDAMVCAAGFTFRSIIFKRTHGGEMSGGK